MKNKKSNIMGQKKFSFKSKKSDQFLHITLIGHFDYDAWDANEKELLKLPAEDDKIIIIDCSKITYLSSRGLGYLISLYGNIEKKNGEIRLVAMKESIKNVMIKTGYLNLFKFFDTIEEAKK